MQTSIASLIKSEHKSEDNCIVYVGGLDKNVEWHDLKKHMQQAGNVLYTTIKFVYSETVISSYYGLVTFATAQEANSAIQKLNGSSLFGKVIEVRRDRSVS